MTRVFGSTFGASSTFRPVCYYDVAGSTWSGRSWTACS